MYAQMGWQSATFETFQGGGAQGYPCHAAFFVDCFTSAYFVVTRALVLGVIPVGRLSVSGRVFLKSLRDV